MRKRICTSESSIEVGWVAKKAPSSRGGDGRPSSSSSTTDGFTESGVPSAPTTLRIKSVPETTFSK